MRWLVGRCANAIATTNIVLIFVFGTKTITKFQTKEMQYGIHEWCDRKHNGAAPRDGTQPRNECAQPRAVPAGALATDSRAARRTVRSRGDQVALDGDSDATRQTRS